MADSPTTKKQATRKKGVKKRNAKSPATKKSGRVRRSEVVAVIDIGAISIRMAVAEIHAGGAVRQLDSLIQPVELGRDSFNQRFLTRGTIEKSVEILRRYRRTLLEYGIESTDRVRVVATSAVREASNRLAFIDRVYVATGLDVEVMDEAEVNRITFMGVMPHLHSAAFEDPRKVVVVEMGGGSTELLVIRGGNVLHSESFRLGALRLQETLRGSRATASARRGLLESHIKRTLMRMADQVRVDGPIHLVALGGDMRFAGHCLLPDWDGVSLTRLDTADLRAFADKVLRMDEDQIVKQYGASFLDAQTLGPALLTYSLLTERFSLDEVYLCEANLRDGLLRDMASGGDWTSEFRDQTIRSARALGRRFDYDESYANSVAELSRRLFTELADEHKLSQRFEVLLYVASLLHEIGLFINVQSNHKHAFYIIRNSELFGLSKSEKNLVGLIARYYRRAFPQPSHEVYRNLNRDDRVAVAKAAALLRLAIALNDTRSGRIREIRCLREEKRLVIVVPDVEDVSLERLAMQKASGLFQEIFGVPVLLRTTSTR
ncbi:Ppx/GppA phosphatase family protein [Crateriforma spongiae]|uniref:Ppx/GppA phosphatase family protein n=1 Tax=Crateriforma spongiae TaxID=2724528 RepID=UPI0014452180|nr:Ppx/GppA phosphatase family protein [Crateriforma spongiae]